MALNGISTATSTTPTLTKVLRRDLKLAEAQAKRQSQTTSTWYRPLNILSGTHSAYVNGASGATLETLSGTASPTPGRPWSTGTVATYTMSILSFDPTTGPGSVITTCNEGDTIFVAVEWTDTTVVGGPDSYLQLGGLNITAGDLAWMGVPVLDPIPWPPEGYTSGIQGAPLEIVADMLTEGNETLTWTWYVNSATVASASVTIVDTSLTPPSTLTSGTSLSFSGSAQYVQVTGTRTDWNLGDNWTIEWWENIPSGSGSDGFRGVMSQDSNVLPYAGIDIFHEGGRVLLFNSQWSFTEPTRGQWNHIAIQKNGATVTPYVNGVANSMLSLNMTYGTLSNSGLDLAIGTRTYDGGTNHYGQWFKGQIANIRISNVARYSGTFQAPTTVVVDANTKLALDGSVGSSGMLDDVSANNHTITNNGAVVTSI